MLKLVPEQKSLSYSQRLLEHIFSEINAHNGKISFARYMELALYTPELGYYQTGTQKFGLQGDFITAPELQSPLFSKCLARQCQEILERLGKGDILEIGAGSGQMAADILIELDKNHCLPDHYYILELSADLKHRQQEKIGSLCPALLEHVQWLTTLPKPGFQGIMLGNEVIDAMPVHRFQITEKGLQEMEVIETKGKLEPYFSVTKKPELLELYESQDWNIPYTSEINLNLKPWILSLSDILKSGVILLIDYGFPRSEYYHPDRTMGTFMCHYRHHNHTDPFFYPGLQDLTAHVDFTAIAEVGSMAGMDILGFTHQAAFLLNCGLTDLAESALIKSEKEKAIQNHAIHMLTSPAEMGELFKVIALGRKIEEPLLGFNLMDKRYAL